MSIRLPLSILIFAFALGLASGQSSAKQKPSLKVTPQVEALLRAAEGQEPSKRLEKLKAALAKARRLRDRRGEAETLGRIGQANSSVGSFTQALESYNLALRIWDELGDPGRRASNLNNAGNVYADLGQNQEALRFYTKALALNQQVGDKSGEATVLGNMAVAYFDSSQFQNALGCLARALPIVRQTGNADLQVYLLSNMARVYGALGQPEKAVSLYESALTLSTVDSFNKVEILTNLAQLHLSQGNVGRALECVTKARSDAKSIIKGSLTEAHVLLLASQIEIRQGAGDDALKDASMACAIAVKTGSKHMETLATLAQGDACEAQGQNGKAGDYYERALTLAVDLEDTFSECECQKALARSKQVRGDLAGAQGHLQSALLSARKVASRVDEASVLVSLAKLGASTDPALALSQAASAESIFRELRDRAGEARALRAQGDILAGNGRSAEADVLYRRATEFERKLEAKQGPGATAPTRDVSGSRAAASNRASLPTQPRLFPVSKHYALLIATDQYDDFDNLANPVADAKALEAVLRDTYGFEVTLLENPTQTQVYESLDKLAQVKTSDGDQLFVFVAGHGSFQPRLRDGLIVLKESKRRDLTYGSYLSFVRLTQLLDALPIRHILLSVDICFGGAFDPKLAQQMGDTRGAEPSGDLSDDDFIEGFLRRRTRRVLASATGPAEDGLPGTHSPFASKLLALLEEPTKKIVDFFELRNGVKMLASHPSGCTFGGNEADTNFMFVRKARWNLGKLLFYERPARTERGRL